MRKALIDGWYWMSFPIRFDSFGFWCDDETRRVVFAWNGGRNRKRKPNQNARTGLPESYPIRCHILVVDSELNSRPKSKPVYSFHLILSPVGNVFPSYSLSFARNSIIEGCSDGKSIQSIWQSHIIIRDSRHDLFEVMRAGQGARSTRIHRTKVEGGGTTTRAKEKTKTIYCVNVRFVCAKCSLIWFDESYRHGNRFTWTKHLSHFPVALTFVLLNRPLVCVSFSIVLWGRRGGGRPRYASKMVVNAKGVGSRWRARRTHANKCKSPPWWLFKLKDIKRASSNDILWLAIHYHWQAYTFDNFHGKIRFQFWRNSDLQ